MPAQRSAFVSASACNMQFLEHRLEYHGRLLPVLCNPASALDTSPLLWSTSALRCHSREIEMRGDVKAQHLTISVMASEGDHTFQLGQIPRPLAKS